MQRHHYRTTQREKETDMIMGVEDLSGGLLDQCSEPTLSQTTYMKPATPSHQQRGPKPTTNQINSATAHHNNGSNIE